MDGLEYLIFLSLFLLVISILSDLLRAAKKPDTQGKKNQQQILSSTDRVPESDERREKQEGKEKKKEKTKQKTYLVILLKRRKILTSLGELSFLHTFSDEPMHESTLRVE